MAVLNITCYFQGGKKKRNKKGKPSEEPKTSVADLAYRRAKAAKSVDRLVKAGKIGPQKKLKGSKTSDQKDKNRKAKAEELFEGDFSEEKRKKSKEFQPKKPTRKPGVSKRSFKSKSRSVILSVAFPLSVSYFLVHYELLIVQFQTFSEVGSVECQVQTQEVGQLAEHQDTKFSFIYHGERE